ncbi:hypothetical protein EDB80DRAFT_775933 [Ilyonectria destructans]|nr:hypothetical protein EDB80DRAFT_775933 [Ilyonectria destructans]
MSSPPVDVEVSRPAQAVLTAGSYAVWLSFLIYTLLIWRKEKTLFYTLIMLSVGWGGLFEPIYDKALMLYFYRHGQWTTFTSMDIPQPVWVCSGYATLYGTVAVSLNRAISQGINRKQFFQFALFEFLLSSTLETVFINAGAYEYWGPHVFRLFKYPLVVAVLETAQVMLYSVAAATLRARSKGILPQLGLFVIFPMTFMAANIGAGGPLIISLHSSMQSEALVTLGTLASTLVALMSIYGASYLIPELEGNIVLGE